MNGVFVFHDIGDADAGAQWRSAMSESAWPEPWRAPDLPGHGAAPAPFNGAYDPSVAIVLARDVILSDLGGTALVVGRGEHAYPTCVLAIGGLASAVVLVDGLSGPWQTPREDIDEMYSWLRSIADDPDATADPPPNGLDPRARYGYGIAGAPRAFCGRLWRAVKVPALLLETPASTTPAGERAERASWFGGSATLVEESSADPGALLAHIAAWAHA
jgi:hypothetical protein